jgi:predicted glycogen debranching enzyme
MIRFGAETLNDRKAASTREWLETNGIGGFASSTPLGLNTRRYHGLLVAATRPPAGRMVLLSKIEETLVIDGRGHDLGTNQYSGAVHPEGYRKLAQFRLDPFPVFTFEVDGIKIEKSVFMVHGQNSTVVQYRLEGQNHRRVSLEIRPLIAFRDYHSLTHENDWLDPRVQGSDGIVSVRPYEGLPAMYLSHDAQETKEEGFWYRNFEYDVEKERGLDYTEDLFNPLVLRFDLGERNCANVIASLDPQDIASCDWLREKEVRRRTAITASLKVGEPNPLIHTLTLAADQYIVARGNERTIIAGYPWFTDWGRDTMIALPGLTIATGRLDDARSVLLEFARHVDQGMLPNRFPDAGDVPEYNTIDATLWYFEAVRAFVQRTKDVRFVDQNLYAVLSEIIAWHSRGTRYGIRLDADGLIVSDDRSVQLTWMDAKIGDWVVTPRHGKAVEIQALWYNAVRTMESLARWTGKDSDAKRYSSLAVLAARSFNEKFWNHDAGYLYDTISAVECDSTMRPNQILAVSLPYGMLNKGRAAQVVAAVERDLFTPFGLRSLSPADPRYRGHYEGDPVQRDSCYHQGPVWPWLLGPFIDAYVKVHGKRKARGPVHQWLSALESHLSDAGLGHVSEILDGDAPHQPRGCFAQAWSVAEVLRVALDASRWMGRVTASKAG